MWSTPSIRPRLAPLAPIRAVNRQNEEDSNTHTSVLDELPQPIPRRRLRAPDQIAQNVDEEKRNEDEPKSEETEKSTPIQPYQASQSARLKGPLPLDIESAFQIESTAETFESVKSPTEKPGSSRGWVDGLSISSPPIRSPTQKPIWELPGDSAEPRPPRRRLSQWLAEDPDIKMVAEAEEKKRAERQRLERENTMGTMDEEEEIIQDGGGQRSRRGSLQEGVGESKDIQQPKPRTNRRESIKVHLQRIKQKAEKVLEEVHDRFVESGDHSAVAPMVTSPPPSTSAQPGIDEEPTSQSIEGLMSPLSPQSEPIGADSLVGDQRVLSPTPSQSSRRTVSSAEIKDKMRTKIRKQAEKVVERTRGSVQLTRRLQRRATFRDTEEGLSNEEIAHTDSHINQAIQLGSKFLRKEESRVYSDEKQMGFIVGETKAKIEEKHSVLHFIPAKPVPDYPEHLFEVIQRKRDLEAGNGATKKIDGMDFGKMAARVSRKLLESNGSLKRIDLVQSLAPFSLPLEIPDLNDPLVHYQPAIHWKEANKRSARKFVQLDVEISQLIFEHHWLAGMEDILAMKIRALVEIQLEKARKVADGVREIAEKHASLGQTNIGDDVEAIVDATETNHRQFEAITVEIKRLVGQLNEIRSRNGYATNPIHVRRAPIPRQFDGEPFALSEFFLLTDDHPIATKNGDIEKVSNEERLRLSAINKCEIQISIFFNEIPVYRTPPRAINPNFTVNFDEVYNLEIYSPPEAITIRICERFSRGEFRELCSVGIPLPDEHRDPNEMNEQNRIHFASDLRFDRYENSIGADCENWRVNGVIYCGAQWGTQPRLATQIQAIRKKSIKEDSFHLFPPCTQLVSEEEFQSDIRLEILAMRYERRLWDLPQYRRIPLDASEIDTSLLLTDARRDPRRQSRGVLDSHREKSLRYATLIRSELLERFKRSDISKSYSDLVREEPLPTFFGAFSSLFGPVDQSRRLKPMRQTVQRGQLSSTYSLVVNVQSAVELPTRNEGQSVETFVQIAFQGETAKTNVASGRNPTWQHTTSLPVRRESDESELKTIMDTIEISVYDQLVSQLPVDDRVQQTVVHEQLTRRFIASVRCSVGGNIEGQLRLQLPLYLLGYSISDKPCYIRLLIALTPSITPPRLIPPQLNGSLETPIIEAQSTQWLSFCSSDSLRKNRRYVAFVSDSNGRKLLPTRYLSPVRPPPSLNRSSLRSSILEACRIVSLIPFLSDPLLFPGVSDVWTTIDQLMQLCCGDEEEHAVLLVCWLLSMGVDAKLVLGTALPEGDKAAFVLVQHPEITALLNPSDGNHYSLNDALCPLISVDTVVTSGNLFGNIQPQAHPSTINWDLTKKANWKPLWENVRSAPPSVQPDNVNYPQLSEDVVIELRSTIEREVRVRFDAGRPYGIPQWNLLAARALREVLQEFDSGRTPNVEEKLSRVRESFLVSSSAIRIPFHSVSETVDAVLRLLFHVDASPNVQFAVAVHVEPFFSHIISVSIAVAALTPKNL
ncbi:unnamed protein product, partial [Mesorhabditis belari]|uniref:C2 domain-containing protein n=1 Tax=Mesorhabditis belari TaxID=2138241 RepID=A0AAF3F1T1_9BILA